MDAADAFSNEALDVELRELGVGHLCVPGIFADQCVYWTARGALNRNYRVTVIPEALGTASAEDLADALADFRSAGAEVLEPGTWPRVFENYN
ncbi:MAG: cysteine hydrolase [Deltaproteobacteria bacterium]|nr:cysteine hydrolase [Deltaproteobacteria bacterium]MBW2535175.1 cysteine hydrolase [Deltaproteobacteria bacterium]